MMIPAELTIGEFARLTRLRVKTLHHYHDIGLLIPERVDASSGYRVYTTAQVPAALLVRRLRELGMPLAQVRQVVDAPDLSARDEALRAYLVHLARELEHSRNAITSLRSMLTEPPPDLPVVCRAVPTFTAFAVTDSIPADSFGAWGADVLMRLDRAARTAGVDTATTGCLYSDEFFTEHFGEVTAFVPVPGGLAPGPGTELRDIPGSHYAVTTHFGECFDLDRTYAALGARVAEHFTLAPGPIREV
ncbi:MAG: MerR family transcriptional regulator, partial [Mycobacteriaceae bacterium]|nr:MerR family transcriptional regulator [Mycobacteriaceae bacterium]